MGEGITEKWLVVHPKSFLWALDEVADGRSPEDVMIEVLALADLGSEEKDEDEQR